MKKIFSLLILVLRKIGVLRYGIKNYRYTSAKDIPTEAFLDDVYNVKKDTITKDDLKKILQKK